MTPGKPSTALWTGYLILVPAILCSGVSLRQGNTSLAERLCIAGTVLFVFFLWKARSTLKHTVLSMGQVVSMAFAYSTIFVLVALFTYYHNQNMTQAMVALLAGVVFFCGYVVSQRM